MGLSLLSEIRHRRKLGFTVIAIVVLVLGYQVFDQWGMRAGSEVIPTELAGPVTKSSIGPQERAQNAATELPNEAEASGPGVREKSIAVLPFSNRSVGAQNAGLLADGIHDDLLANLSRLQELKVIARPSMMAYRESTKSMPQIGQELSVGNVVEGAVQLTGQRVRISVQLIDAGADESLWAKSYDRELSTESWFEIQAEITAAIAEAVGVSLSPELKQRISRPPTPNFDAFEAVLNSRQALDLPTFDSNEAAEWARKAIELDPDYTDAHVALAFVLARGVYSGAISDEEAGPEIRGAIETALALSPDDDEAWSALGRYQAAGGESGAAESFDRAMQLNPGNVHTLFAYGNLLRVTGKPEQALPLLIKANERDPLSRFVLFSLGSTYDALEKPEESRAAFSRIRELDPSSALGYVSVSGTYIVEGQIDLALYWLDQGQTLDPQDFGLAGWMVLLYDSLEDYGAASQWSKWLDNWVTNQPLPMAMQASHHYQMGNFETAVQYSNLALRLGLPDHGGSDAIFMRIKRDEALATGDPESGIEVFRSHHPGLFDASPQISSANLQQAVDLAFMFQLTGGIETVQRLLGAAIEFYDQPWSVTGSARTDLVPAKAEALAILGDERGALKELRRIIDKGWRLNWRWETELNFNFSEIRETVAFKEMVTDLQADMAFQRANVDAMAARGDIRQPPRK